MKFLNSFHLKLFGIFFMLMDHLAYFLPNIFPLWLRYPGRMAAPIFFFIAVQGFIHTSNQKKYIFRLYTASMIMYFGSYFLSNYFGIYIKDVLRIEQYFNIFLTIALGITFLAVYEWSKRQKEILKITLGIFTTLILTIMFAGVEYSFFALFLFLIFYFGRISKLNLFVSYTVFSFLIYLVFLFEIETVILSIMSYQWYMIFALPFFIFYNDKKGANFKYLFYIFYPLHVWLLYVISIFLAYK